jgi:multicomponent Na+:H+ antiporter subunit G
MNFLSDLILFIGSLFMFLAAVGLIRMPDMYTRLQAGTKAATLGSIAMILGIWVLHPEWSAKLLLIIFFILLTSPVGSSTIARSAFILGHIPWIKTSRDQETPS